MTPDSMVIWFSMTKAEPSWWRSRSSGSAAALQLDDPVVRLPPRVRRPRQGPHHAPAPPHPHRRHPVAATRSLKAPRLRDPTTGTRSSPGSARSSRGRPTGSPGNGRVVYPTVGMTDPGRDRPPARRGRLAFRDLRARGRVRAARHGRLLGRVCRATCVEGYGDRIGNPCTAPKGLTGVGLIPLDTFDVPQFLARCVPGGGGRGPLRQARPPLRSAAGARRARRPACSMQSWWRRSPPTTASALLRRDVPRARCATGASGSAGSTPTRWLHARRHALFRARRRTPFGDLLRRSRARGARRRRADQRHARSRYATARVIDAISYGRLRRPAASRKRSRRRSAEAISDRRYEAASSARPASQHEERVAIRDRA